MSDRKERLGKNGAAEIKAHPFFYGIKWSQIKNKTPGFLPEFQSKIDTKYFDNYEEEDPWWLPENDVTHKFNYS